MIGYIKICLISPISLKVEHRLGTTRTPFQLRYWAPFYGWFPSGLGLRLESEYIR